MLLRLFRTVQHATSAGAAQISASGSSQVETPAPRQRQRYIFDPTLNRAVPVPLHPTLDQDPDHPLNMLLNEMRQVIMEGLGPSLSDDDLETIKFLHELREKSVDGTLTPTQVDQQVCSFARMKVDEYFVDESKNTWIRCDDGINWMLLKDRVYEDYVASLQAAARDFCRNEFDYKEKLPTGLAKDILNKVISVVKKEFRVLKIGSSIDPSKNRSGDNKTYPAENFIRESMEIFGLSLSVEQRYACERFAIVVAASFGVVANKNLPRSTIPYTDEGVGADLYVMPSYALSSVEHFALYEEHRHGQHAAPGFRIVPVLDSESPSTSEQAAAVDTSAEDAVATESPQSSRPASASVQANDDTFADDVANGYDVETEDFNSSVDDTLAYDDTAGYDMEIKDINSSGTTEGSEFDTTEREFATTATDASTSTEDLDRISPQTVMAFPSTTGSSADADGSCSGSSSGKLNFAEGNMSKELSLASGVPTSAQGGIGALTFGSGNFTSVDANYRKRKELEDAQLSWMRADTALKHEKTVELQQDRITADLSRRVKRVAVKRVASKKLRPSSLQKLMDNEAIFDCVVASTVAGMGNPDSERASTDLTLSQEAFTDLETILQLE